MNREQYLRELLASMEGVPESEKKELAADYEEHFRMGTASGKSEEAISRALGNPKAIGRSYRIDSMLDEGVGAISVVRAVFATMSLGFLNLVVVLGPFIGLVAVLVAFWAAAAAIGLSGIALLFGSVAQPLFPAYISTGGFHPLFLAFTGIGVAALGVLAVIGMWQLSRWVVAAAGKYVRLNVRIVTNRR